jgi:hypothetical protein
MGNYYTPSRESSLLEDYRASRLTVLDYVVNRYSYQKYLEIGTNDDASFNHMKKIVPYAIGVDPESGGNRRMTSDEFFKINSESFDLIFVDGLHEANQVFRDVQNSLRVLSSNGTIVMHDCNPRGYKEQAEYPIVDRTRVWCGDTWKAVVALRMSPDIDLAVVDIDFGVGIIRQRPNRSPLSDKWRQYLSVNPISMLNFHHLSTYREELINLISLQEMITWLND